MRRLFVLAAATALGVGVTLGHPAPPAHADTGSPTATPSPSGTPSPSVTANPTATPSPAAIVATAQQYLGYPYAYIGDDPSTGFSCIGFVHFVFAQNGVYVPEDLSKAYASAPQVDQAHLQPGDLVFFQNTVWNGISHVDIYAGNGQMIGADTFQTGVEWDTLSDAYWQAHYLGATRPLAALRGPAAGIPATGTATAPSATPEATASPTATPTASATPSVPTDTASTLSATPTTSADTPTAPDSSPAPSGGPGPALAAGVVVTVVRPTPVYSGPGDTFAGIDIVTPAMSLTVVQTLGRWVNISYANGALYGWILGSSLTATSATTIAGSAGASPSGASGASENPAPQTPPRRRSGEPDGPASVDAPPTASGKAVITADVLFVRSGPVRHARILRRVHRGDRVTILATTGGWYYVQLRDGSRGWVSADWVRASGQWVA